jgi:hypothetical protein
MSTSPDDLERRTIPEMFCRGVWMMFGPMLLVPITYKIIEHGSGWFTVFDGIFIVTLIIMVAARGFEFFKGKPRTAEGTPATPAHLRRYVVGVVGIGLPLWIAANVMGNYVL